MSLTRKTGVTLTFPGITMPTGMTIDIGLTIIFSQPIPPPITIPTLMTWGDGTQVTWGDGTEVEWSG